MRLVELWQRKAWKTREFGRGGTRFFSPGLKGPAFASKRWGMTPVSTFLSSQLALGSNGPDQKSAIPDPIQDSFNQLPWTSLCSSVKQDIFVNSIYFKGHLLAGKAYQCSDTHPHTCWGPSPGRWHALNHHISKPSPVCIFQISSSQGPSFPWLTHLKAWSTLWLHVFSFHLLLKPPHLTSASTTSLERQSSRTLRMVGLTDPVPPTRRSPSLTPLNYCTPSPLSRTPLPLFCMRIPGLGFSLFTPIFLRRFPEHAAPLPSVPFLISLLSLMTT